MAARTHSPVIKSWSDGAAVQSRNTEADAWVDDAVPTFNPARLYRLKPVALLYRVAEFTDASGVRVAVCANGAEAETALAASAAFVGWLTSTVTVP